MYSAKALTKALGGDWHGTYGMAPGPGHSPCDRSLKIIDGPGCEPIFHSFSGDDWRTIKDDLRSRGILPDWEGKSRSPAPKRKPRSIQPKPDDSSDRRADAAAIWKDTQPIGGSAAETYLRNRGIATELPVSLRFAYLKHGRTGLSFPTLVAGVQDADGRFSGIHRTFLKPDGAGKAEVSQPKMALGSIAGGTVRLAPVGNTVALVEGIEDGLAVQQMTGQPAWACLGTSGFKNFDPPETIKQVILAPDADNGGEKVIDPAARRLADLGLDVRTAMPAPGKDWCDMLMDFEERAAIREFDGEEDRETAEHAAWIEVLGELI
jgi:hypothetical protein